MISVFACQEDGKEALSPEEVLRTYQAFIDQNDVENAKKLSTPKEQIRLAELEKIIQEEAASHPESSSVLQTIFHSIQCEQKETTALCLCDLEDEYERYEQEFNLVKNGDSWLVDAPKEEIIIDDEIIQEAIDSLDAHLEHTEIKE